MTVLQALIDGIALGSLYALVAMGLGLMFGVMRLINFAYGELITVGAYTLLLTDGLAIGLRIALTLAAVILASLLMERLFRPLRGSSPATMLVATFALALLVQNSAVVVFGTRGESVGFLSSWNQAVGVAGLQIRWVTIASILLGAGLLTAAWQFLSRTSLGLQMRAAAMDLSTARLLGVRVNRVVVVAFVIAGVLAGTVSLMLVIQRPLTTPTFGFFIVIPALVGVVIGGMDRLVPATLGGFLIGVATGLLGNLLPSSGRVFLDSVLFGAVIAVLLVRPNGLFLGRGSEPVERL